MLWTGMRASQLCLHHYSSVCIRWRGDSTCGNSCDELECCKSSAAPGKLLRRPELADSRSHRACCKPWKRTCLYSLQCVLLGSFGSSQIKIWACSCGVAPLTWMLPCFNMFHHVSPMCFFLLPLPTRSSLDEITAQDPSWSGKRAHHLRQAWPAMNECSYWILLVGLGRRVNSLSH